MRSTLSCHREHKRSIDPTERPVVVGNFKALVYTCDMSGQHDFTFSHFCIILRKIDLLLRNVIMISANSRSIP